MTNNSPLPVKFTWFFIRRPPVVRQDPDLQDEGVDMESDYDSDEVEYIKEEGEEEEEEGEGEGESTERTQGTAGDEEGSVGEWAHRTIITVSEDTGNEMGEETREVCVVVDEEGVVQSEGGVVEGVTGSEEGVTGSEKSEGGVGGGQGDLEVDHNSKDEAPLAEDSGSKRSSAGEERVPSVHVKIVSAAAVFGEEDSEPKSDDLSSTISTHNEGSALESEVLESGIPPSVSQPTISSEELSQSQSKEKKKKKKKKQKTAWEKFFDPFKPIPISQVSP